MRQISLEQFIESNKNVLFFANQFYNYWYNTNPPKDVSEKLWFRFYEDFVQKMKPKIILKPKKYKIKENEMIYWK